MSDKKKCFIIMPFGEEGTDEHLRNLKIYQTIIKPIAEECGYLARRADELEYLGNITHDIIEWLYQSELVIADLSGRNPNVFYELGVRHALLRAGTIPIMRKGEEPPFDIAHYRTIFYSIELDGPENLKTQLRKRILAFENEQGTRCDNPVHEVLGNKILQIDTAKREIANQQQQLKALQQEHAQLRQAYQTNLTNLQNFTSQATEWAQEKVNYQTQIAELEQQLQALIQHIKLPTTTHFQMQNSFVKPRFRSEPKLLSHDDVKKMLLENDFFDRDLNPKGVGFAHDYQERELNGAKIIWDEASGLMWQQGGSENKLNFENAEDYIKMLNRGKYAGFSDWRLPTLEEAASLLEPKKNPTGLYIDARFDAKQRYIWTIDQFSGESRRWVVYFAPGYCANWKQIGNYPFVRAVRLGQSSTGIG